MTDKPYEPTIREMTEETAPLKKWEKLGEKLVKRDATNGRFVRGSKPLPHAHRPKGSLNKTTLVLKEAILNSLDRLGGEEYLMNLAIENSSAYASLIAKILPSTLAADESAGNVKFEFRRIIVEADGHEVEDVTPKSLPAPDGDKDQ